MLSASLFSLLTLAPLTLAAPAPQTTQLPGPKTVNSNSVHWKANNVTEVKGEIFVKDRAAASLQDCADYCTPNFALATGLWFNATTKTCNCYGTGAETLLYSGPSITIYLKRFAKDPMPVGKATFVSYLPYKRYDMTDVRFLTTTTSTSIIVDIECANFCHKPALIPHQVGFVVANNMQGQLQCECFEVFSSEDALAVAEMDPGQIEGKYAHLIDDFENRIRQYSVAKAEGHAALFPLPETPSVPAPRPDQKKPLFPEAGEEVNPIANSRISSRASPIKSLVPKKRQTN